VFSVDKLFNDPDYQTGDFTPAYDNNFALKTYDNPPHSEVILEFTEDEVDYVVVKFNHEGNPPSNDIEYLYLAA
jgi:hypothetical protein